MSDRDGVRAGAMAWLAGSVLLMVALALLPPLRVGTLASADWNMEAAAGPVAAALAELLVVFGAMLLLAGFAKWEHALRRSTLPLAPHLGYAMGMTLVIVVIAEATAGLGVNPWLLRGIDGAGVSSGAIEAARAVDAARFGALVVAAVLLAAATAFGGVGAWYDAALPRWPGVTGVIVSSALAIAAVAAALEPPADPMRSSLGVTLAVALGWGVVLYAALLRAEDHLAGIERVSGAIPKRGD